MNVNNDLVRHAMTSVASIADDAAPAVVERGNGLAEWTTAAAATGSAFDAITGAGVKPFGAFASFINGNSMIRPSRAEPILESIDQALQGVRVARAALPKASVEYIPNTDPAGRTLQEFDKVATAAESSLSELQEIVRRGTRTKVSVYANTQQQHTIRAVSKLHEFTHAQARTLEHDEVAHGVAEIVSSVRTELNRLDLSSRLPREIAVARAADGMLGSGGGRA